MDEKRIYGLEVAISQEKVHGFYEKRASIANASAVLLGNAEAIEDKNAFERDNIIPKLNLTRESRVLDIGCGNGRVSAMVLPLCGFYCGVDFSESMVAAAEKVCRQVAAQTRYALHAMSFSQAVEKDTSFFGGNFDAVLVPGVCTYINDAELKQIFNRLPRLLSEHCALYFTEPVGVNQRLSLVDFPSEALQTEYNAIYRTPEEYMTMYAPLLKAGFSIVEQTYWPRFGETYTDTRRWHAILKR